MRRTAGLGFGLGVALLVSACSGSSEPEFACPRVAAIQGLDRMPVTYPGNDAPSLVRVDVLEATCTHDDAEGFTVESAVAIQIAGAAPQGQVQVPYSVSIDTPGIVAVERTDVAVIPAGSRGTIERFSHNVGGVPAERGNQVRILYSLVPDEANYERLEQERPRGG
ncbi:MAG: hypothetical protein AAFX81_05640 [Pseudomonadota bacterium]